MVTESGVGWSVMCLSVSCQLHVVLITLTLQNMLKSGRIMPAALFFAQDCFGNSKVLCFPVNVTISFSSSAQYFLGILISLALNLKIALGSTDILPTSFFQNRNIGYLFNVLCPL